MTKPRVKRFEDPNLWIYEHVLKNGVKTESGRIMKDDLNRKAAEKLREIIEASKRYDRELKELNCKTDACLGLPHRAPKIDVNTLPFSPLKPRSKLVPWKRILPEGVASAQGGLGGPFGGKVGGTFAGTFPGSFPGSFGGTTPSPQSNPLQKNAPPKSEEKKGSQKSAIFSKMKKTKRDEICKVTSFFSDHMSYYDSHLKEKYMSMFLNSLGGNDESVKGEDAGRSGVCQRGDTASVGVPTPSGAHMEGVNRGVDAEESLCSNATLLEKAKRSGSLWGAPPNGEVSTGHPAFKGPRKGNAVDAAALGDAAYPGDTGNYSRGDAFGEAAEDTPFFADHLQSWGKREDASLASPLGDTPRGKATLSEDKSQTRKTPMEETDRSSRRGKALEGNSSNRRENPLQGFKIFEKMNSTSLYGGVDSQGEDSISYILQNLREEKKKTSHVMGSSFSAGEEVSTVDRNPLVDDPAGATPLMRTIVGGDAYTPDRGVNQVNRANSTQRGKGQPPPKGRESILQFEHLDSNNITVEALSQHVGTEVEKIINVGKFILDNEHITKYTKLEKEVAELICEELGLLDKLKYSHINLKRRNPVVTILGHVDHGKTTLLDRFRNSNVAQNEIGGITQKLGAFEVVDKETKRKITFLDTPGHSVFKKIRQRCAQCTDLIILVISLDDGIMSETVECIQLAKKFNIPFIIAANKMDKFGSDLGSISKSLVAYDVVTQLEENGNVPIVPISAKEGINIDMLQRCILQMSDSLNLLCDYGSLCCAYVLEKKVHPSRGKLLTMVCKSGTLKVNSYLLIGHTYTKVKQIYNCNNQLVREAYPSEVVQIVSPISLAQDGGVNYGDLVFEMSSLRSAQRVARYKLKLAQYSQMGNAISGVGGVSGDSGVSGGLPPLPKLPQVQLIIKAGDEGSVEAILEGIAEYRKKEKREKYCDINNFLERNYVKRNKLADDMLESRNLFDGWEPFRVVSKGVGPFNLNDLKHCSDVKPVFLIAFNVDVERSVQLSVEENGAILRTHTIIYKLFEDLETICNFYFDSLHLYEPVSRMVVNKTGFYTLKKNKAKRKRVLSVSIKEGACSVSHFFTVLRNKQVIHKRLSVLSMQKNKESTTELGKDCSVNSIIFNTPSEDFQVGDEIVACRKVPRAPLFNRVRSFDLAV
ncbi:translation initiation factor IF-2 [Plasmodium vivax India VII]|uniref:Translation initiation factor IF-2 n=1 Tax=Plasmodium vivax India VII TaxID=1077284 RepID=A0A0J9SHD6_PLAVI|nr:translation initiation factor IF-2 [Plasmodium vivax India VII]